MKRLWLTGLILGMIVVVVKFLSVLVPQNQIFNSNLIESAATIQSDTIATRTQLEYAPKSNLEIEVHHKKNMNFQQQNIENTNQSNSIGKNLDELGIDKSDVTAEQELVNQWDSHYKPPEPTDENAIDWIDSPHADQIHLVDNELHCVENCADELNVNFESVGEFSDQINSSALKALAEKEGLLIEENDVVILKESGLSPAPPTEDGAWIDPP